VAHAAPVRASKHPCPHRSDTDRDAQEQPRCTARRSRHWCSGGPEASARGVDLTAGTGDAHARNAGNARDLASGVRDPSSARPGPGARSTWWRTWQRWGRSRGALEASWPWEKDSRLGRLKLWCEALHRGRGTGACRRRTGPVAGVEGGGGEGRRRAGRSGQGGRGGE